MFRCGETNVQIECTQWGKSLKHAFGVEVVCGLPLCSPVLRVRSIMQDRASNALMPVMRRHARTVAQHGNSSLHSPAPPPHASGRVLVRGCKAPARPALRTSGPCSGHLPVPASSSCPGGAGQGRREVEFTKLPGSAARPKVIGSRSLLTVRSRRIVLTCSPAAPCRVPGLLRGAWYSSFPAPSCVTLMRPCAG